MSHNEFAYFNFNVLRSNNDTDYTVNLCVLVNCRIISEYSGNRIIPVLTATTQSRTRAIIDSFPRRRKTVHAHSSLLSFFTKLLFYRSTPPPYSLTAAPNSSVPLLPPTSSGTRRIRGISYLAQIQSYEYNFPREQSFIVIVNPSVNWLALSITDVAVQLRPILPYSFLPFSYPLPSECHHS